MKRIKINKNKSIGSVIYIVEGKVTEQNLIKNIFNQLLDYELYQINGKEKLLRLKSKTNKFSKVAVITSKKPQISTLIKQEDFFDNIYHYLSIHDFDVENSAIYYIFDRDRGSNDFETIKKYLQIYKNSRDNDDGNMNGLFLLGYPSIEAFYLNINKVEKYLKDGKTAKKATRKQISKQLNKQDLINNSSNFLKILNKKLKVNFTLNDLDNMERINIDILNKEEQLYYLKEKNLVLAQLTISLLDLGIIEII